MSRCCRDWQVQRLLSSREDVFPNDHLDGVEATIEPLFELKEKVHIAGSERTLFLFKRR